MAAHHLKELSRILEPPEHLSDTAKNAYLRIYMHLEKQGLWEDLYTISLEIAAQLCANYLEQVVLHENQDNELEAKRIVIREFLADFFYIPKDRIHLVVMNENGIDNDICELCKPLPDN